MSDYYMKKILNLKMHTKYGIILVEEITKDNNQILIDPLKVQDYSKNFEEKKKTSWETIHN